MKPSGSQFDSVPLFHGTPASIPDGGLIEPTPDRLYGGPDKAYASTSQRVAGNFAHSKTQGPWDAPKGGHQGRLFAQVYNVEAPDTQEASQSMEPGENTVTSTSGYRVTGLAGYRRTDDMNIGRTLRTSDKEESKWL